MQKAKYIFSGFFLFVSIILRTVATANAEEVKVTTYYPSPYGVYKELSTTGDTDLATGPASLVVIGSTSPGPQIKKLNVIGDMQLQYSDAVNNGVGFYFQDYYAVGSGFGSKLKFISTDDSSRGSVALEDASINGSAAYMTFSVDNASAIETERMRIATNGNVGIGTTNIPNVLNVHSTAGQGSIGISGPSDSGLTWSALYLHDDTPDNNNNWAILHKKMTGTPEEEDALHIARWVNPSTYELAMTIQPNGNVGIGPNTNPQAKLDVRGTLLVKNGNSIIRTMTGVQQKMQVFTFTPPGMLPSPPGMNFGNLETKSFAITWPQTFGTGTPVVAYIGNYTGGGMAELINTISNTSTTGAQLYIANPRNSTYSNVSYTLTIVAIGPE